MKIRDLSEWEKRKVTIKLQAKEFVNQTQKIILLLHVVTFIVIQTKKRLRDLEETEVNQRQNTTEEFSWSMRWKALDSLHRNERREISRRATNVAAFLSCRKNTV